MPEEVVKEYMIDKAKIKIVRDPIYNYKYIVEFPPLDDVERKIIREIIAKILADRRIPLSDTEKVREIATKLAKKLLKKRKKVVTDELVEKIVYYVLRDTVGFGKLEPVMKDPNIEDIHIMGHKKPVFIWYVRYDLIPTNIIFDNENDALIHIQKILFKSGKYVSYTKPIADGNLGPGFRVHIAHKAVSPEGTQLVIRKHKEIPFLVTDLIRLRTAPPELFAYLWVLVENKRSILIIGETAAGKTTLLNAIATLIPMNMKIVVVEEVRELFLPHENVSYLVTKESVDSIGRVTLFDLVKAAMRQRPDYIIVGEIRGEEAFALFQAMTLGHGGLATMHADDPESAVHRLMMKPLNIPPYMLRELEVIVNITKVRLRDRVVRYVVSVSELLDIEDSTPKFNTVYRAYLRLNGEMDTVLKINESHALKVLSERKGLPVEYFIKEVEKRCKFLQELAKQALPYHEVIKRITLWGKEHG